MTSEILIFDDDPGIGYLLQDSLEAAGYRVQLYADGTRVKPLVEELRPRLVILDIMMPGLDGLAACKTLRANPTLKNMRIAVCSGKVVGKPDEAALRYGADAFIPKPFDIADFLKKVHGMIGAPAGAAPEAAGSPIFVTTLGARSSGTGISLALEIGETLLVLDAGPGFRNVDPLLVGRKELRLIFTHYHADHVGGLGHLRDKSLPVALFGPNGVEMSLRDVVQKHLYTPGPPKCPTSLYTIVEGSCMLTPQVRLSGLNVNHPGTTMALRVEAFGKSVVFCPDNEVRLPQEGQMRDSEGKLRAFARNADLLIHDARYTPEDYQAHRNEGHSSYSNVVDLAVDAGVKRLMLTHLDSSYEEEKLKSVEAGARAQAQGQITDMEVFLAREGSRVKL